MKVIMLKKQPNVGDIDDIVDVADGFGENFLIKKGIAILATPQNLERRRERLLKADEEKLNSRKESTSLSIEIRDTFLNIFRSGHNGKMFGSVTSKDISEELNKIGIDVSPKKIKLNKVNNFGTFSCIIDCGNGIKEELEFMVEEE